MDIEKTLAVLTAIPAVSGHEDLLIADIVRRLMALCGNVHTDKLGNVTATFNGRQGQPSIAFFAHLDELGLIVRHIEPDGFLRVERVGGVPEKALLCTFVDVHSVDGMRSYPAVVGTTSHHLTPAEKKFAVTTVQELYVDMGVKSKSEAEALGVGVGSMITYCANFRHIGDCIASKALDDRMGVLTLLALAEYLHEHPVAATVHLIFTVQEEFSLRACLPAFTRLMPDAGICVDIAPSCDTPELKGRYDVVLGKGPAVLYMNFHGRGTLGGLLPNPALNAFLELTAKANGIPFQREAIIGVITDDAFSQYVGTEGIPMAHLSIPMRYSHAPVEVALKSDIEYTIQLLCAAAQAFGSDVSLLRGGLPIR